MVTDTNDFPPAASERGWAQILPVSRDTLRVARRRGDLTAVSRPGRRRLVILRDGPGGVMDWLARCRLPSAAASVEDRVEAALAREARMAP